MKIVSTYGVKIKTYKHIFKETIGIYRHAVDFLIGVCLNEWDVIKKIEQNLLRQQYVERLCHSTKRNPDVVYDFDEKFYKFPSFPAISLIQKYRSDHVLIYCDPPYLLSTRSGGKQYRMEMDEKQHTDLLEVLLEHPGPVVLSGYDSELYRNMLDGWHTVSIKAYSQVLSQKTEMLWMNYNPNENQQLSFF